MRHPRIIVGGIGLAVVAAVGGVTAASAGSSPATSTHAASTPAVGHGAATATVRTAPATVAGKAETILVNAHGLPLYF
jgi:hypothetical protein